MEAARLIALALRDVRNLAQVDLDMPHEGLVIVGDNGQGKTNLLEAIAYLQILRSVRGAQDQDLVRFGAPGFHIAATVDVDGRREIGVGFERVGKRKRVRVDGVVVDRLTDALGSLPSVMFSPADVALVAGGPAERRRFLDILLALTSRGYLTSLQRYRGALVRRNAALRALGGGGGRDGTATDASVAAWEPLLAEHGAALVHARRVWVDAMSADFASLCAAIGETGRARMRYVTRLAADADPRDAMAHALATQRSHDLRRGLTHVGPHRDDLAVTLDDRDLRTFGSAGQQRTASIALRMLEATTLRQRLGRTPLFLLDDPFAELDARRAAHVLSLLEASGYGQVFLAVPKASDIPRPLTRLERRRIERGELRPWSDT